MQKQYGFSMIELAVVLTIVGIVMSMVLPMLGAMEIRQRTTTTVQGLHNIEIALRSFIVQEKRLPCPALPNLSKSNPNYGFEASTPGNCDSATISGNTAHGIVPWRTLDMSSGLIDGYGQRFTYAVLQAATIEQAFENTLTGQILVFNNEATPVQINNGNNSIVLVMSHGKNGYGGYLPGGNRKTLPSSTPEQENTDDDNRFIATSFNEVSGNTNEFDDRLIYWSQASIAAPIILNGLLDNSWVEQASYEVLIEILQTRNVVFDEVGAQTCVTGSSDNVCVNCITDCQTLYTSRTEARCADLCNFQQNECALDCYDKRRYVEYSIPAGSGTSLNTLDDLGNQIRFYQGTATIRLTSTDGDVAYRLVSSGDDGALDSGTSLTNCQGDDICEDILVGAVKQSILDAGVIFY